MPAIERWSVLPLMVTPQVWDPKTYDAARRRLVPDFDAFYGTAAFVVARSTPGSPRILDLGAGTGLLSQAVAERVTAPRLTLHDASASMLDVARVRLAAHQPHFCIGSLQDALPPGPFDAVISALSIHHLQDSEKRDLFARTFAVLAPGGVLVNADQVAGPSGWHDRIYQEMHRTLAQFLGSDDAEWSSAQERMRVDIYATVDAQLRWLQEAGYERGDCFFKRFGFAVFAAWRPGGADGA